MVATPSKEEKAAELTLELVALRDEFIVKNPPTLRSFLEECVRQGYGVGKLSGEMVKKPDYFYSLSPREQKAVYKDVERAAALIDRPVYAKGGQPFIPSTITAMVFRTHKKKVKK